GVVLFRGANVFGGYLEDPEKTKAAFRDCWCVTGDLGRFDDDGFLFIEGRLSRFSKIGGEMVPHETVEQKILAALELQSKGDRTLAVTSVADPQKGEALVLLSTQRIDQAKLRSQLHDTGVANLWIPKVILLVEQIPVLATGKLDLRRCSEIAEKGEE